MDFSTALKFLSKAPADPVSSIALKTFNEFLTFGTQIHAVDRQTRDLLSTTRLVASNIKEASRLQRLKYASLDSGEMTWIGRIIEETENALTNIAELIEPARVDKELRGGIDNVNKIVWVIKDHPKIADMHARLSICHQSLIGVITCLHTKSAVQVSRMSEGHVQPHDRQLESFLSWQTQRKRRKSVMSIESGRSFGHLSSSSSTTAITTAATSERSSVTSSSSFASMRPSDTMSPCMLSLPELDESALDGFDPFKESDLDPVSTRPSGLETQYSSLRLSDPFVERTSNVPESSTDPSVFESTDYFSRIQGANTISPTLETALYHEFDPSPSTLEIEGVSDSPAMKPNLSFEFADGLQVYNPYSPYHDFRASNSQPHKSDMTASHTLPWLCPSDSTSALSRPSTAGRDSSYDNTEILKVTQNDSVALNSPGQSSAKQPLAERAHSDGYLVTHYRNGPTEECALDPTLFERPKLCNFGRRTVSSGRRSWMAYHASRHYNEYG